MLKRLSRTNPSSVKLKRCAVSTARLEGAPTAASMRDAGHQRFLHQLEAGAAADEQQMIRERRVAGQHFGADQFIHRVVPAHVLPQKLKLALGREQRRRVQPAGSLKDRLRSPQGVGKTMNDAGFDHRRVARQHRAALHLHLCLNGFDGSFAADAAAGGGVEVAFQAIEIKLDAGVQLYRDGVAELARVAVRDVRPAYFANLIGAVQDTLAEQEAGGQLEIVARGAHRDGDGSVAKADLEGLFDGQQVLEWGGGIAFDFLDRYRENGAVHTDFMVARRTGRLRQVGDLDDLLLDGVLHQLGFVVDVELAHQVELVRFHGFDA